MTKVSSLPKNIWHWFADHVISPVRHTLLSDVTASVLARVKQFSHRFSQGIDRQRLGVWFIALLGSLLLMVWDGRLLISITIGLGAALLIQQQYINPATGHTVLKWLSTPPSTTVIAIGCGFLSLIASYLTLQIWHDTNSLGLAIAILLQSLGLLTLLCLFGWRLFKQDQERFNSNQMNDWINHLTALDPLKRLIAVRQICRYFEASPLDDRQTQEIREYFHLLQQQESEPSIQNAILEGLAQINSDQTP